jgi:hypothetical protein
MVRLVDLCIGSKGTRAVKSLPSVSLYMRTTTKKTVGVTSESAAGILKSADQKDAYCLHFYKQGKRKWLSVGTDLNIATAARGQKEQELLVLNTDEAT